MSRAGVQMRPIWPGVYLVRESRSSRSPIYLSLKSGPILPTLWRPIPNPKYRCCHPTGRHRQGGASWLVPLAPSAYLSNIYARGLCVTERAAICEAADRSGRHVASALNSRQTSATSSDRKTRLVMCHRSGDFPGLRRPSRGARDSLAAAKFHTTFEEWVFSRVSLGRCTNRCADWC